MVQYYTNFAPLMAIILCIETATEVCSVALTNNNNVVNEVSLQNGNMHASHLHVLIKDVLQKSGISLNQLQAIAVSMGPGSYTGLRVGVSAAKGLCYALNIPLITINTLHALANGFIQTHQIKSNALFIPMLDARRMEVYTCILDKALNEVETTHALIVNENSFSKYKAEHSIYCFGNGALKCRNTLTGSNIHFELFNCNAAFLAGLAYDKFKHQQFANLAYFEPYYLKDFVTTVPKK
jgi:tRNA threonylcarbamoyladenosine biosynthesis protein TsaB